MVSNEIVCPFGSPEYYTLHQYFINNEVCDLDYLKILITAEDCVVCAIGTPLIIFTYKEIK